MTIARSTRILLWCCAVVTVGTAQLLSGQSASKPSVQTNDVKLFHLVSVEVTVFSPDQDLLVPYCGDDGGRTEPLCVLPAYLEVQTCKGWQAVKLRHSDAELGWMPLDRQKVRLIPAGQKHDFSFGFRKEELAVEHGQHLRIVVSAWPDEQSMKDDKRVIHLSSPAFECP